MPISMSEDPSSMTPQDDTGRGDGLCEHPGPDFSLRMTSFEMAEERSTADEGESARVGYES